MANGLLRVLVVNWQDRTNPHAGGAELHLHEVFGRIAREGVEVDLLCSGFRGAARRESIDGIDAHRIGGRYSFPFRARAYYRRHLAARSYDVLVEDINKVPLFTPRWGAQKVVALVHHLFGTTAFREASPPVAAIVWVLERGIPKFFEGVPFQAVSESTAEDLVRRGVPRRDIRVIYNGVDGEWFTPDPEERAQMPVFSYVGRLRRYKRVDILIRAFAKLGEPRATLEIAGKGPDEPRLRRLARSLDLTGRVKFLGFVSEQDKLALLRRSWATLLASPNEGWGISNLESAACGTPVIAGDAPGVRESVVDGVTGFLVRPSSPDAFAGAMRRLVTPPELVSVMGVAARRFAERFTWDRAARETLAHLNEVASGGR